MKVKCKQRFEVQAYDIGLMSTKPITIITGTIWEKIDNTHENRQIKLILHGALVQFQIETEKDTFERYFEEYEYVS